MMQQPETMEKQILLKNGLYYTGYDKLECSFKNDFIQACWQLARKNFDIDIFVGGKCSLDQL